MVKNASFLVAFLLSSPFFANYVEASDISKSVLAEDESCLTHDGTTDCAFNALQTEGLSKRSKPINAHTRSASDLDGAAAKKDTPDLDDTVAKKVPTSQADCGAGCLVPQSTACPAGCENKGITGSSTGEAMNMCSTPGGPTDITTGATPMCPASLGQTGTILAAIETVKEVAALDPSAWTLDHYDSVTAKLPAITHAIASLPPEKRRTLTPVLDILRDATVSGAVLLEKDSDASKSANVQS